MTMFVFHATWCGPCKQYAPVVDEVENKAGVPVLRVDIDKSPALVEKYGVTSVPTTILVDEDGYELNRLVGFQTRTGLYDAVDNQ